MSPPVRIEILGREYFIKSNEGEERIREIAEYVNRKIKDISEGGKIVSTLNIAILVALNIADDYFRIIEDQEKMKNDVVSKTKQIVHLIDLQIG
jgi:cell division protein ZapA